MPNEKMRELAFNKWVGEHDRHVAMEMLLTNRHVAKAFEQYLIAFIDGYNVCMIDNLVEADDGSYF